MNETLTATTASPLTFRNATGKVVTAPTGTRVQVQEFGNAALLILNEWVSGRDYSEWFCTDATHADVIPA